MTKLFQNVIFRPDKAFLEMLVEKVSSKGTLKIFNVSVTCIRGNLEGGGVKSYPGLAPK